MKPTPILAPALVPALALALVLVLAITDAVAAVAPARDLNFVPAATPTGKPETCIPIHRIRQTHVRNDSVIDFEMLGRQTYRVTLAAPCPGLGFEERFGYATSLDKLCSSDIITVLYTSPQATGASCGLAPFQPVDLAKR